MRGGNSELELFSDNLLVRCLLYLRSNISIYVRFVFRRFLLFGFQKKNSFMPRTYRNILYIRSSGNIVLFDIFCIQIYEVFYAAIREFYNCSKIFEIDITVLMWYTKMGLSCLRFGYQERNDRFV